VIIDPSRTTVVAWYDTLPDGLALLVDRVQAAADRLLDDAFTARTPEQVHATLIGLEQATAPFDPRPLAAHLHAALSPPWTIRFGGFAPDDRRHLSRGLPLHDRGFGVYGTKAVLVGWPVVGDTPTRALAELRLSCAECGVVHRYGDDPDVYMVIGDVAGVPAADAAQGVCRELAAVPQNVPLSADDLSLVTYVDTALPRESTSWRPLTTDEP
jgi:hypothetical protein